MDTYLDRENEFLNNKLKLLTSLILTSDYIKEAFCINFKVASIGFTYLHKMSLNNPFWGLKSNSKVAAKVLIKASNLEGVK